MLADILQSIERNLTRDLLSRHWARVTPPDSPAVWGHCAVAAEAVYHLLGGADAGLTPVVCKYHYDASDRMVPGPGPDPSRDETHWWVRLPQSGARGAGAVVDPTAAQYDTPFPYGWGRGCGFQSPHAGQPSKRARVLMARVAQDLGVDALASYRRRMVAQFQSSRPAPAPGQ